MSQLNNETRKIQTNSFSAQRRSGGDAFVPTGKKNSVGKEKVLRVALKDFHCKFNQQAPGCLDLLTSLLTQWADTHNTQHAHAHTCRVRCRGRMLIGAASLSACLSCRSNEVTHCSRRAQLARAGSAGSANRAQESPTPPGRK